MAADPLIIAGGFGLGLASTLHCAGMCGGLSASLMHLTAPPAARPSAQRMAGTAALTHAGRIASYALAGMLAGSLGAPAIDWLDRELAFRMAQWAAAVALMWIGLSTAGLLPSIAGLDRVLAPVSNVVAKLALPRGRTPAAFVSGLAWGLMPCAMVYGALFTAMLSGSALGGGAVMAAFGMGTLPGLVAATAGYGALRAASTRQRLRVAAGLSIAAAGFLTVWVPYANLEALCGPAARAALTQIKIWL